MVHSFWWWTPPLCWNKFRRRIATPGVSTVRAATTKGDTFRKQTPAANNVTLTVLHPVSIPSAHGLVNETCPAPGEQLPPSDCESSVLYALMPGALAEVNPERVMLPAGPMGPSDCNDLLRGIIVNWTYGTHKNLYLVCLTILINNIWSC